MTVDTLLLLAEVRCEGSGHTLLLGEVRHEDSRHTLAVGRSASRRQLALFLLLKSTSQQRWGCVEEKN